MEEVNGVVEKVVEKVVMMVEGDECFGGAGGGKHGGDV